MVGVVESSSFGSLGVGVCLFVVNVQVEFPHIWIVDCAMFQEGVQGILGWEGSISGFHGAFVYVYRFNNGKWAMDEPHYILSSVLCHVPIIPVTVRTLAKKLKSLSLILSLVLKATH